MVSEEGRQIDRISIIFCSDDYLLEINKSYLSHNYYTDIITFSLASKEEPLVSDIYISIDRVRENAKEFASSFTWELHRVIFHGILHLCGYEDKIVSQSKKMRRLEDWYLGEYFVSREIDRI